MKTSKTIADVVRVGVCVDADRVPCETARKYLDKKGLICRAHSAPKKHTRKRKKKGFWETLLSWF